jgi:hypothetical protein
MAPSVPVGAIFPKITWHENRRAGHIASVEGRDRCGYQLGRWFSERTPHGVFRNVPVDADSYGIDESVAANLIDLIRNGQPLPPRIVRLMPEFPTNVGGVKV